MRAYLLSAESQSDPNNRPRPHATRAKRQNEKDQKCPPSSSLTPQEQPKTPQTTRSSASPSLRGNDVAWMDSRLRGNDGGGAGMTEGGCGNGVGGSGDGVGVVARMTAWEWGSNGTRHLAAQLAVPSHKAPCLE